MRTLAALYLLALACHGQIHDLATTDDGGQLYFSFSQRLKGTNLVDTEKVIRYLEGRFEVFEYSPRTTRFNTTLSTRTCCDIRWPRVSGDGRTVMFVVIDYCNGGSPCAAVMPYTSKTRGTFEKSFFDRVQLSPDGRYVLGPSLVANGVSIFDSRTGASTELPEYFRISSEVRSQHISADGTMLLSRNGNPVLWKAGEVRALNFLRPLIVRFSANAATVVYETSGLMHSLFAYHVASGQSTLLAQANTLNESSGTSSIFQPTVSADGTLVAYLDKAPDGTIQAFLQRTDGTGKQALTSEDGNVFEVVLAGFGKIAYAVGARGRLIKVDISSASVTELAKVTPSLPGYTPSGYNIVPGALFPISRLLYPTEATGLTVNGHNAPLVGADAKNLIFQIPWEVGKDETAFISVSGIDSPFEDATTRRLVASSPNFDFGNSKELYVHQDFSGPLSGLNPARPGEIVHIFLTGLGAVSPPVATGAVTPFDTVHRAVAEVGCRLYMYPNYTPVTVLFAGLAPGFVGLNQLDIRIPDELPPASDTSAPRLECGVLSGVLPIK